MSFGAARLATEKAVFRPALLLSTLPGISEMRMGTLTYKEQLLHPNWQRKRQDILTRDNYSCTYCGDKETTLHVHHKRYIKGRMVWDYENDDLDTLCAVCHKQQHSDREFLDEMLAGVNVDIGQVIGLVAGFLDGDCSLDIELANKAMKISGSTYDLGILACIASRAEWPQMAKAAREFSKTFTPQQRNAIERWEEK